MKTKLSLLIILLMCRISTAQNLVPNGDFEQYTICPNGLGQINSAISWTNPNTASPDYFNHCSTGTYSSVPINTFGYQQAHSGDGYAGLIIYVQTPPYTANQREYAEVQLTSPLIAGSCYYFQMYVNHGDRCKYAAEDLGIYFSDTLVGGINSLDPLPFTPQIVNTTGVLSDTVNWVLVDGNYTASGGENYLIIGNFKNDSSTNVVINNPLGTIVHAHVYVDDVSLTICTNLNEQINDASIKIFPNPSRGNISITTAAIITQLKITNTLGQLIYQTKPNDKRAEVKIDNKGIYFVSITTGSEVVTKKVVVND